MTATSFNKILTISGNDLGNKIIVGKKATTVYGGAGAEAITGGKGADVLYGDDGTIRLKEAVEPIHWLLAVQVRTH